MSMAGTDTEFCKTGDRGPLLLHVPQTPRWPNVAAADWQALVHGGASGQRATWSLCFKQLPPLLSASEGMEAP